MNEPQTSNPLSLQMRPKEGWHVLHLFYHVDHAQWDVLPAEERIRAKTNLTRLVHEIRATPETQLLVFSMLTPKADVGFMLLTPDLHVANAFEKRLTLSLGPEILTPSFSYLSMTEWTEYATKPEEHAEKLKKEKGLDPASEAFEAEMAAFKQHQEKYYRDRLYPNMPDWQVFCFYPMSKRRNDGNNWYHLEFNERRRLMGGHAITGRKYAGKVRQLITGSTGLDEYEWGVTLFAHDTFDIKSIVYDMRFDEVSAKYAEFGDFYIGLQVPLDELFRRLLL